jgi:putative Holliday junction resolvase
MGLDIGDRRVGVALSDDSGSVARGLCVLSRRGGTADAAAVAALAAREDVGLVVAGLPRTLRGDIGPQADKVLAFVGDLRQVCPVAVELWDERLTTRIAERSLAEANVPRGRRRGLVDRVAAAVILQGFLDARGARRPDGTAGACAREDPG